MTKNEKLKSIMVFKLSREETEKLYVYGYLIKDDHIFVYDADEDTYMVAELLTGKWEIKLNVEDRNF